MLNSIEEDEIEKYLTDDSYCLQEKFDGRNRLIFTKGKDSYGANRKGLVTALDGRILRDVQELPNGLIINGEDMGDRIIVFDLLDDETPYSERYDGLYEIVRKSETLILAETAWETEFKRQFYEHLKKKNAEGIVFKDVNSLYKGGRPSSYGPMLKFKFYSTCSCVVTGINTSKRSVSLSMMTKPDEGFSMAQYTNVGNITVYPNQEIPEKLDIVEIRYLYAYPEGSLYQPVLLGVRDDLGPLDCMITQLKYKRDE